MIIEDAQNFFKTGQLPDGLEVTAGEMIQLMMGACLEDNGDIFCCICNKPNEVCTCGYETESSYGH